MDLLPGLVQRFSSVTVPDPGCFGGRSVKVVPDITNSPPPHGSIFDALRFPTLV